MYSQISMANNAIIYTSIGFFCVAAIIGIILITQILNEKTISRILIVLHTVIATTGLILLLIYTLRRYSYYLISSLTLFVLAAGLGIILIKKYIPEGPSVKAIALCYALMALSGLIMLFVFTGLYL